MIIVIQCAGRKRPGAGYLVSPSGRPVIFVAHPKNAPPDGVHEYARPDDPSENGSSWRDVLLKYNGDPQNNELNLSSAYQLYENRTYGRLVDRCGTESVYILSAGWGLIGTDFLTPYYDITFSQSAKPYQRRRKTERYEDFQMLQNRTGEDILFFGCKDYLPLFCSLTSALPGRKTVFYNSAQLPQVAGYSFNRFDTRTRTNWHYECANAFLDGLIQPGSDR
jgi:hypothetical protein